MECTKKVEFTRNWRSGLGLPVRLVPEQVVAQEQREGEGEDRILLAAEVLEPEVALARVHRHRELGEVGRWHCLV